MSASKSLASARSDGSRAERVTADPQARVERLRRRAEREHAAREEAERLLENKSLELFAANQRLTQLNAELEKRVDARTRQLDNAHKTAIKKGSTDYLTGIANRLEYSRHLERSLSQPASGNTATGLLFIDIDGFKLVNDTYGHSHGDQMLITLARRLKEIVRSNELVARIGGDEFAVILQGADAGSMAIAAERFRRIFERPITIFGVTVSTSGSMGLAVSPDDCTTAIDLQRFADLALYRSKKQGRGEVVAFERTFLQEYEFRQRIEAEFRGALSENAIDLHYQPIISLRTGRIEAVESLARWTDSRGAEISPAYFIPLAEQCGIIRGVGNNLLEKALIETNDWILEGRIDHVSFNVSPLELLDQGFAEAILSSIDGAGVHPRHLVLEITEGAVLKNIVQAEQVMNRLRAKGVEFALDDFGCGYSNLASLGKLPISMLKIDRSLLVDAGGDTAARVILRHVVALCKELAIKSICEGAETDEQISLLREMDCDAVQGFASGPPLPAPELEATLFRQREPQASVSPIERPAGSARRRLRSS